MNVRSAPHGVVAIGEVVGGGVVVPGAVVEGGVGVDPVLLVRWEIVVSVVRGLGWRPPFLAAAALAVAPAIIVVTPTFVVYSVVSTAHTILHDVSVVVVDATAALSVLWVSEDCSNVCADRVAGGVGTVFRVDGDPGSISAGVVVPGAIVAVAVGTGAVVPVSSIGGLVAPGPVVEVDFASPAGAVVVLGKVGDGQVAPGSVVVGELLLVAPCFVPGDVFSSSSIGSVAGQGLVPWSVADWLPVFFRADAAVLEAPRGVVYAIRGAIIVVIRIAPAWVGGVVFASSLAIVVVLAIIVVVDASITGGDQGLGRVASALLLSIELQCRCQGHQQQKA